ncbi:glycoside hydrolase family 88/105 protein [Algibacillus agarilyticus]|uniref:glycoside hydrolase family 88/105 protein n=1 Tax=Algibacillus agarilyticus TaxID=2234133 RepID=UPI000DD0E32B|nr:glycoside hydrolase family 88 protein [Algibacillus agarilyticus]
MRTKFITAMAALALLVGGCSTVKSIPQPTADTGNYPSSTETMKGMEKVANWQLPRLEKLDYLGFKRKRSESPKEWIQGTFFVGLAELAERSNNPIYEKWINLRGNDSKWELGHRAFHADDHLFGDVYLWHYKRYGGKHKIAHIKKTFDTIIEANPTVSLEYFKEKGKGYPCFKRWCWADALFMSPPTWYSLTEATGDQRYANYAAKEFKATIDYLYDTELDLVYRDSRFRAKTKTGQYGEQVFWSRGIGWVIGGLVRTLEYVPTDHPDRAFYENTFKKLAAKLKTLQKRDGSWAMSLLAREQSPYPETSGTGFFTYGLAWGIKNGILDKTEYWPTVASGWQVMVNAVHPDGKLGWVQGVNAAPGVVEYGDSQLYGVGAYLLAGSVIYDLAKSQEQKALVNEN